MAAKLKHDDHIFQIITVYAPNVYTQREAFFNNLWHYSIHNIETIVAGDLIIIIIHFYSAFSQ